MKGIVLAGGKGMRLRPITLEIPKPLITIKKKPLINYNLDLFRRYGVLDVKIIIKPEDVKDYSNWQKHYADELVGMNIEIVVETEPMGTFGYVLKNLASWLEGESFFITNGDDIKEIDLGAMQDFHKNLGVSATIALMNMEDAKEYGSVTVKEDKVIQFIEKNLASDSKLVSAGMYFFSPSAINIIKDDVPSGKDFLMAEHDIFPLLVAKGELGGFVCEGVFFDCGTLERWEKAILELS